MLPVVARKLVLLSWSAVTQSSAVRLAGWATRRVFGAGAALGEELGAGAGGMHASEVAWAISSGASVGMCPVTMIEPALSSALASVARSTAGGHW